MRESLRKSGIDIIGDVPWGTHFCQFYQTKEDLMDILVPYFRAGLENNELCVWITSQPLEIEEAKEAMKRAVPDIDIYLEKGQMEIIPYTQGYIKEGIFDPDRVVNSWAEKINQVLASGYDGLRASGDNRWLEKEGWDDFVDYEEKVDAFIDKNLVIALCPYYLDMCRTAEVIDVISNHQFALIKREGKWERIENSGRRRAEKEAIQAAKNWKSTFDAVPDLVAIIDDDCRIVRANRAMAARLGVTPEECAGLTCCRVIHGTDKTPSLCPHRQLLEDGAEHTIEVCEERLGGYFAVSTTPLHDSERKLIGSVYVARDINERKKVEERLKESEEKYRNIVETASEGILRIDAEVRITYANKKITEMLGYSLEELIGRFLWNFADEEGRAILKINMEKRLEDINEVYELKLICKDGSPLWALISAKAFFDKESGFTGSLGMFTDITKRKQEEHRVRRYNRILEGINWIFSNVVQAKTEEELGNACLSVALEVTGSEFGFINEMGADGLLHDVAKSELGWEQCFMYDKTGHRRPPSDFVVHGLYGSVIINEKGFFTNDPQSHPDSIGLPEGHPPLISFLGVPLVQDRKTIGLIAVANHEGGYSCEQQEDLEAIAPAVTQALQRKRSEEALRLSNIYNRSLIEASLDPLVTIGHDGKITDVNGATEKVTGYSRNDLIGTDFSDYFTEPEKARKGYQQVFTEGTVRDYPLEIQHKDGHITPVLYHASVYKDENGEVIGVFAAARDITERKKAEETVKKVHDNLEKLVEERTAELEKAYNSLKESEKGLAEAQEMAHIGNWEWDIEADKAYWSEEMYRIFRRDPQELAPSYNEYLSYIHPDDRDYVDSALKKAIKGKTHSTEYRIVLANGEERAVHMQSEAIFDEKNTPIRVKGIIQDVTERKKAEENIQTLASIVESSNDAILTLSLDGIITSWNKGAEQIYGYSIGEILGKNVSILAPNNLKDEIKKLIDRIRQGIKVKNYETMRLRKDGTLINVSLTFSPIFDSLGKLTSISAIARDITERIKAEKSLAKAEDARKKEVHHRIKNNLQVISSLLDLQADKFNDAKVVEAFRESQNRVISMALIHEELYKEEGTNTLDFSAYLKKLADTLLKSYEVSSKNIHLKMDLEENVSFDMDTVVPLGMIVNELVSNSFKHAFTGRDKGKIRIKLSREESIEFESEECKSTGFTLKISDNGIGIPENLKIKELDSLGFQLVTSLVEQLGGELEVRRNNGTEFIIKFTVTEKNNQASNPVI